MIDNRIVSMRFDNRQFEQGVATTMNSLSGLKKGLDLSGSAKGLESISESAKRVNFDGMSSGLDAVKVKFSALQVFAVTALSNIANQAITTGKNLISSLTIDPIMDGFKEYETQMNSVQTILANTSTKGTTLDQVNSALDELNTYSDKTIYNFTEMTKNIGTFTAAGVDLKTSTSAIKGIANLAAVSGSNSQQASTAMYQLSQAISAGKVGLEDWNSVTNAGMGGEVFKNSLKETAKLMGKNIDVSQSFRDSISGDKGTGWLTSDVLLATLEKFTGDLSAADLAAKGYTTDQIDGILKMGVTANDAATKVKTFTQLLDTLKEAVGSGWAQTWKTLFGNFEEAKVMFTDVSNTLGTIIGASSKARNDLLTGWKDLGGRTVLIDAIRIAFNNVMTVVGALSGAFRDIFPATTSAQLFSLTEGFKSLIESFKLSDTNLKDLRSTFKGVFAVFDIGKTALLAVGKAVGIMLGGVGNLTSSILGITGSWGEWLTALDNSIKQSDVFNKVLSTLAYGIKNGFNGISNIFKFIAESITKITTAIGAKLNFNGFEVFKTFLESFGNGITTVGDQANSMSTTVSNAFLSIGKAILDSKFGEMMSTIWDTVKTATSAIGELISKMTDAITNSLKNVNFDGIIAAFGAMSIGGMFLAFKKFMKSLSDPLDEAKGFFEKIGDTFDGIKGTLDEVRGSLETYQQNLKADILLKIGAAIALLAASIVAISTIDSDKLGSSLAAIGMLFAQLLLAMKVYTTIGDLKLKAIAASGVMIIMATSILILSAAMKNLSELDWDGIMRGGAGVATLAAILVTASKSLSTNSGTMMKGATGMIAFAVAIKLLADVCIDLSKLNWEELKMGLMGVGALILTVSLFLNNTTFGPKAISNAIGMTILAGAIKILASAVSDFGDMDWGNIEKGLKSIGILLAELAVFSNVTGNAKNVISTGVSLIAIGAAMKILASAIKDFGDMDWGNIEKGLKAMGVALAEITIAVNLLPKNLPTTALGLIVVGGALKIIASALMDFGGMNWEEIKLGLIALGGSLVILAIGLNAMNGTLSGSAALLIASGALIILSTALTMLGSMTWESIVKGLVDLAAVIAIFAISAAVLTPIIPSMLGLGAALVLLGVSMLGIGAGLALVGVGLAGVAAGFAALAGVTATGAAAIVAALGVIIIGIAALIPEVMVKIADGIVAFCKALEDGIPAIVGSITVIIKAIVDCLVVNVPVIVDGLLKILDALLDSLIKWGPSIVQKTLDVLYELLKVIIDNTPKFVVAAVDIILAFVKGITDSLSNIIDAAFKVIVTFINGLADAIRSNSGPIADACLNLVTAIIEGIGSFNLKFVEAGVNCVKGFIKGIGDSINGVIDAGKSLGRKALEAAKKALDEHSPSKEMQQVGLYAGEGLVIGLDRMGNKVFTSAYNMGNKAMDAMSNAISGISDIVNSDMETQPVIRPVLDLSNIQNGSNQLYNMMNDVNGYAINGSINAANSTAKTVRKQSVDNVVESNMSKANTIDQTIRNPALIQLVLQNGRVISEYLIDDIDNLLGNKNKFVGRSVGSP